MGFEEHVASIKARVCKAELPLPCRETLRREGVCPAVCAEFPEQARGGPGGAAWAARHLHHVRQGL